MDSNNFVFWLQGAFELNPEMLKNGMTPEQVQIIQDHLNLVFTKVTSDFSEFNMPDLNSPKNEYPLYVNSGTPIFEQPGSTSELFCSQFDKGVKLMPR